MNNKREQLMALESFMDEIEMSIVVEAGEPTPGADFREAAKDYCDALKDQDEAGARDAVERMEAAQDEVEVMEETNPSEAKKHAKMIAAAVAAIAVIAGTVFGFKNKDKVGDVLGKLKGKLSKVKDFKFGKKSTDSFAGILEAMEGEEVQCEADEEMAATLEAYVDELEQEAALEAAMEGESIDEEPPVGAAIRQMRNAEDASDIDDAVKVLDAAVADAEAETDEAKKKRKMKKILAGIGAAAAVVGAATTVTAFKAGTADPKKMKIYLAEVMKRAKEARKDKKWAKMSPEKKAAIIKARNAAKTAAQKAEEERLDNWLKKHA